MSGALIRRLNAFHTSPFGIHGWFHTSANVDAARKGTREKARKKKIKVEVKKIGFIPHNERERDKLKLVKSSRRTIDEKTDEPVDAVYAARHYKIQPFPMSEIVQFHREANHPTVRNKPNASVNVHIELNMVAEKKTRFMDSFHRIVNLPHPFGTYEDRTVLAFCKTPEQIAEANEAGADLAGGPEIVHRIQSGELALTDFKFVISHPAIMPELVPIRGLLKRKFPQAKSGTLSTDLKGMLRKFKQGLQYRCEKDPDEHDLGVITASIGLLEMKEEHLEANFAALVQDVELARPRRGGDFITWVWCSAAPSPERFKVKYEHFLEPGIFSPKHE